MFPAGGPGHLDAIDAFYATAAEKGHGARLDALDQAVYAIDDADDRALAYLREHEEEVLRPERGLPCSPPARRFRLGDTAAWIYPPAAGRTPSAAQASCSSTALPSDERSLRLRSRVPSADRIELTAPPRRKK